MKISLVVPTLNAERFIGPLITRLKEQTVPIDEIVVVDIHLHLLYRAD